MISNKTKLIKVINNRLKPEKNAKRARGEVFTPVIMINEMLNRLDSYHTSKHNKSIFTEAKYKWYDPAVGIGNFPIIIYYRLMDGLKEKFPKILERERHIIENMLYMAELNNESVEFVKQVFGNYKLNLHCGSSLELDTFDEWKVKSFDVVIGNPPYNKAFASNNSAMPLYHEFIMNTINTCRYQSFIVPSRWFFGGRGLAKFRKNMLNRTDFPYIQHFDDASKIFKNVAIQGGVNYYLKSSDYDGKCEYNGNMKALNTYDILTDCKYYGLIEKFKKYPSLVTIHYYNKGKIASNDKRFTDDNTGTLCYVAKHKGFIKYIDSKLLVGADCSGYKVITPRASGGINAGFGNIIVGKPGEIFSDTYRAYKVNSLKEAESLATYMLSELANFMLKARKKSHSISFKTCQWIPLPPLDRLWTKKRLINYFNLSKSEVDLIYT